MPSEQKRPQRIHRDCGSKAVDSAGKRQVSLQLAFLPLTAFCFMSRIHIILVIPLEMLPEGLFIPLTYFFVYFSWMRLFADGFSSLKMRCSCHGVKPVKFTCTRNFQRKRRKRVDVFALPWWGKAVHVGLLMHRYLEYRPLRSAELITGYYMALITDYGI